MPQPYFEMEESRSVTPQVNRLYFESPRASRFLGLRLVKTRHKNLVPLLSGVKPDPMVGSGRYAEPIPVKSPVTLLSLVTVVSTTLLPAAVTSLIFVLILRLIHHTICIMAQSSNRKSISCKICMWNWHTKTNTTKITRYGNSFLTWDGRET